MWSFGEGDRVYKSEELESRRLGYYAAAMGVFGVGVDTAMILAEAFYGNEVRVQRVLETWKWLENWFSCERSDDGGEKRETGRPPGNGK